MRTDALGAVGGLTGVYHSVSAKHLQSYIDEYAFRYNHRESQEGMFDAFLGRIGLSHRQTGRRDS